MSDSNGKSQLSLEAVFLQLRDSNPAEYHEVRFVAEKLVSYFKQPAHEITITSIKESLRFFPLYLSYERLRMCVVEILLSDAKRLLSNTEEMLLFPADELQTVEVSFNAK
jgi:hypothetical protein